MRQFLKRAPLGLISAALLLAVTVPGCSETNSPLGDLAQQCGLVCSNKGILEGNASISGVASVDAFFGSVINVSAKADLISGNIKAEFDRIRASLGLSETADGAAMVAAMRTQFELDGDLVVKPEPPHCEISAKATLEAQAKCDASIDPGKVSVECSGSCQADAKATVQCDASAKVVCHYTPADLKCTGECKGNCSLETAASCEGTCRGDCSGDCSVTGADGKCAGQCTGTCKGSCQLDVAAKCDGSCSGECVYTPPDGKCDASARVECKAEAGAKIKCDGRCDGEVIPPKAKAECEASARANASVNMDCKPPSLQIKYGLKANAAANAQARFEAFLVTFKASYGAILAELKRATIIISASGDVAASGVAAVEASVDATISGKLDLRTAKGLECALAQLPNATTALGDAKTKLEASVSGAASLTKALGSSGYLR